MFRQLFVILVVTLSGLVPSFGQDYFTDHFVNVNPDRWSVDATPVLSGFLIRPYQEGNQYFGELRMENRVTLVTRSEYPQGAAVSLRTTYEDTGAPLYVNQCVLVMRTTGALSSERSWELQNGLRLRVEYGNGKVTLEYVIDGTATPLSHLFLKTTDDGLVTGVTEPREYTEPQVAPGKDGTNWYTVDFTDDPANKLVTAYMTWHRKVGDGSAENRVQIASVSYEAASEKGCDIASLPGKKIALSSREFVGGKNQVSFVRGFKVEPVKKATDD